MNIAIKHLQEQDIKQALDLMKALAVFERYIDNFKITADIIKEKGFLKSPPDFYCLTAYDEDAKKVIGILVYYFHAYTLHNRPALYMKELIVDENYRGNKVGEKLMKGIAKVAKNNNCCKVKWEIVPWNTNGKRFYERLGGVENKTQINYELSEEAYLKLLD